MKVKLKFTEPLLGTLAGEKEIAKEYIVSRNPEGEQQDEIDSLPEQIEKASTLFSKQDGRPFLWDYQIKGFFKEACSVMLRIAKVAELKAYRKIIHGLVFVKPRKIFLQLPENLILGWLERPLRGQTMQGERIALARSEMAPAGTTIEFEIILLKPDLSDYIEKWLDYGALSGLLQWRSGGYGRFDWEKVQ